MTSKIITFRQSFVPNPLPTVRKNLNVMYLHIPKTGGTSFLKQLGILQIYSPKINGEPRFSITTVPRMKHFDWSVIDDWKTKHDYEIITLLRNPVDRAISHFHYIKTQSWVSPDFRQMTLEDFVKDPEALMNYRGVWQDGQVNKFQPFDIPLIL